MRTQAEWQNEVETACFNANDAGSAYNSAKRVLLEASRAVEWANQESSISKRERGYAESAVAAAREELSVAKSELNQAQSNEEKAAARAAVNTARAILSDAQTKLTKAERAVSDAERRLSESARWKSEAEKELVRTKEGIDRAFSLLEDLLESARGAHANARESQVAEGPRRFTRHFIEAQDAWVGEASFFQRLIDDLESALSLLSSSYDKANRLQANDTAPIGLRSTESPFDYRGRSKAMEGNMPLPANMAFLPGSPIDESNPLPWFQSPAVSYGMPPMCNFNSPPVALVSTPNFPAFSTPALNLGTPNLGTTPLNQTCATLPLSITTGSSTLLGLSTPTLGSGGSVIDTSSSVGTGFEAPGLTNGGGNLEIAPIVSSWDTGAVFKGAGNSHFTFAGNDGGWHVTTEVPGIPGGYSERLDVRDFEGFALDGAGLGYDAGYGGCSFGS